MRYYKATYPLNFKGLFAKDRNEWNLFTHLYRDGKYEEAHSKFPKDWEWIGEDIDNQVICDMPLGRGGILLSEKAYVLFKDMLNIKHVFELSISDNKYYWHQDQKIMEESSIKNSDLDVICVKPGYIKLFSERFVETCRLHNITGSEFSIYE